MLLALNLARTVGGTATGAAHHLRPCVLSTWPLAAAQRMCGSDSTPPLQVLVPPETEIPVPLEALLQQLQQQALRAQGGGRGAPAGSGGTGSEADANPNQPLVAARDLATISGQLENISLWASFQLGKQLKASYATACALAGAGPSSSPAAAHLPGSPRPGTGDHEQQLQHAEGAFLQQLW